MDWAGLLFADFIAALGAEIETIVVRYPDGALDYSAHNKSRVPIYRLIGREVGIAFAQARVPFSNVGRGLFGWRSAGDRM